MAVHRWNIEGDWVNPHPTNTVLHALWWSMADAARLVAMAEILNADSGTVNRHRQSLEDWVYVYDQMAADPRFEGPSSFKSTPVGGADESPP